jgi:hypothetical protein
MEGALNHLLVFKIKKVQEKLRDIFQIKDSYTSIWEELDEKLPVGLSNAE